MTRTDAGADFPTDPAAIRRRLDTIDPVHYATSRNDIDGAVTRLSPYITHGVLTLPEVREAAYAKAGKRASYKLVFELAWREYFQRVWWERGDRIFQDIKRPQQPVRESPGVPTALLNARTGIDAIDASIRQLYATGYVHNHARLWTAMLTTNVAQIHWRPPAEWYYYHLLDGDLASNSLSWQWVAGTFSSKKYIANQENINRFDRANRQYGTYLDQSCEDIADMPVPDPLTEIQHPDLPCTLPETDPPVIRSGGTVLLYHPWSLRPQWQIDRDSVRVLVLEPSHFARFPISPRRMTFLLGLAHNIPALHVFVGEIHSLPGLSSAGNILSIAHPATRHFPGVKEPPTWLFPLWTGSRLPGSFMSYWKEVERFL